MKMNFGVWSLVGAIAGWYFTRSFFGGIIGSFVGSLFDAPPTRTQQRSRTTFQQRTQYDKDFSTVLIVLTSAMMKADGNPMKSELNFVKQYFVKQFGEQKASDFIIKLRDYLKKEVDPMKTAYYIQSAFSSSEKLHLIHYLAGIAMADGEFANTEYQLLLRLANGMGVSKSTVDSLIAMYHYQNGGRTNQGHQSTTQRANPSQVENAFKIIGVEKSASEDEIKKAYRKMVVKHHPDKVSHLGEEHANAAKVKFQKIQEAYETVKSYKGMA